MERNCCFLDVWSVLCEVRFAWYLPRTWSVLSRLLTLEIDA